MLNKMLFFFDILPHSASEVTTIWRYTNVYIIIIIIINTCGFNKLL